MFPRPSNLSKWSGLRGLVERRLQLQVRERPVLLRQPVAGIPIGSPRRNDQARLTPAPSSQPHCELALEIRPRRDKVDPELELFQPRTERRNTGKAVQLQFRSQIALQLLCESLSPVLRSSRRALRTFDLRAGGTVSRRRRGASRGGRGGASLVPQPIRRIPSMTGKLRQKVSYTLGLLL